jgi:hypothetical protein
MPFLQVHAVRDEQTAAALQLLDAELAGLSFEPRILFTFYGCDHDDRLLHAHLKARFPRTAIIGGSSSGGVMTQSGVMDEHSIGVMLIDDADGDYGVAAAPLGDDAALTAERLLLTALAGCGCSGQLPELIWVYQAPGREEAVVEGLRRVVGDRCPIVGGSSGDNDVSGRWRQLGPDGPMSDGVAIGVLLPSAALGSAFQGGYEPTGQNGVVTSVGFTADGQSGVVTASSGREIVSIDGEPAAAVYNRWIGGQIDSQVSEGGTILAETTMVPLATDAGRVDGVAHYLLIHPESVTNNSSLRTFCNVDVGARLYAMTGNRQRLVERAGRVAGQAMRALPAGNRGAAGALIVYCGGCKMAVGEDIGHVAQAVTESLGGAPFIGCFTFGEQGQLLDRNVHGNLMISAVVFGR